MEDFGEVARKAQGRVFRIRVEGRFDRRQADWFEGFDIQPVGEGETELTGSLPDQAALHGLFKKLRDLGVALQVLMAAACAGIAIGLYPVLRERSAGLAIGAVAVRPIAGPARHGLADRGPGTHDGGFAYYHGFSQGRQRA